MNKKITILYLILNGFLFSQFYDIKLDYEKNISIKDEHKYILEEFNERISNYFKYTKYATEYDFLDIPLNINIIYHSIDLLNENTYQGFDAQILISNDNDQYFVTKTITIPYYKGKDIYYNANQFNNIASLFDYYAYVFIANDLDTYGIYLGEKYYNLALNLTNYGIETNNSAHWNNNKNTLEKILQNNNLRIIKYDFFYVLDSINEQNDENKNINQIKESLDSILKNLKIIYEKYGYEKETLKFVQAYNLELAELFNIFQIKNGLKFLINFDYKNKEIYEQFSE
tara:strand:- start:54 stop:908 length:855 start_codon:yes stop_codon:yes gene_type:complete